MTTATMTYQKFAARTGTQPPDVPTAPSSASDALREAVDAYRDARQQWLDAEAHHAAVTSDEALRQARQADVDAERERAARGDYSDTDDTAGTRLEADQRAALRRVTAAQDHLIDALHMLEAVCGGDDVAAPIDAAVATKARKAATVLAELAGQLDAPTEAQQWADAVLTARRNRLAYVPTPAPAPGPVAVTIAALTEALT